MAATAGSNYQKLLLQHIAGNPPQTDPQRTYETFPVYVARMSAQGCLPDIGSTESDSDYLARIASYNPLPLSYITASTALTSATSSNSLTQKYGVIAWGLITGNTQVTSSTFGCSVTRLATGSYGVALSSTASTGNYAVNVNGFYNNTTPSASDGYAVNQNSLNFTMSVTKQDGFTPGDFATGSFHVISI